MTGEALEQRLEKLMTFRKYLQIVERRLLRDIVQGLLERDARDKAFFTDRERVEGFATALSSPVRTIAVQKDEEHQAFALAIEDRSVGYPRHYRVDQDFVSTGEFRTLAASYQEVKDIRGPMIVKTTAASEGSAEAEEGAAAEGGAAPEPATAEGSIEELTRRAMEAKPTEGAPGGKQAGKRDAEVRIESIDELVEFFTAAGRKGVAINRYKGLGEMNPETLWETTMDPAKRMLAQVRAEDHMEADLMFTTLMGDQVEPRRKFIEDNALDVKNLDI
jgi:DNA gyrase subunit B